MEYTVSPSTIHFQHVRTVSEIKKVLVLEAYRLRDVRHFSVDASSTHIVLDIAAIADALDALFAHADSVSIRNARVSNVDALGRIAARAKRLSLCNIQLDVVRFKLCPEITHIDLSDNPIAFVDLTGYPQLRHVCLDRCPLEMIDMDSDLETRCRTHNDGGGFSGVFVTPRITPSPLIGRQMLLEGMQMKEITITDNMTHEQRLVAVTINELLALPYAMNEFVTSGNLCVDYIIQSRCQKGVRCNVLGVSFSQVFQIVWSAITSVKHHRNQKVTSAMWWTPGMINVPESSKKDNVEIQKRLCFLYKKVKECVHGTPEQNIALLAETIREYNTSFNEKVLAKLETIVPVVIVDYEPVVASDITGTDSTETDAQSFYTLDDEAHAVAPMYPPATLWNHQMYQPATLCNHPMYPFPFMYTPSAPMLSTTTSVADTSEIAYI